MSTDSRKTPSLWKHKSTIEANKPTGSNLTLQPYWPIRSLKKVFTAGLTATWGLTGSRAKPAVLNAVTSVAHPDVSVPQNSERGTLCVRMQSVLLAVLAPALYRLTRTKQRTANTLFSLFTCQHCISSFKHYSLHIVWNFFYEQLSVTKNWQKSHIVKELVYVWTKQEAEAHCLLAPNSNTLMYMFVPVQVRVPTQMLLWTPTSTRWLKMAATWIGQTSLQRRCEDKHKGCITEKMHYVVCSPFCSGLWILNS